MTKPARSAYERSKQQAPDLFFKYWGPIERLEPKHVVQDASGRFWKCRVLGHGNDSLMVPWYGPVWNIEELE